MSDRDPVAAPAPAPAAVPASAAVDPGQSPFDARRQRKWFAMGLGIGLVFLWLALRHADFAASWAVLRDVRGGWTVAVLVAGFAFMLVKTLRWSLLLHPVMAVDFGFLQRMVFVGTAANLVVAHTGELLRATTVARRGGGAPSAVLATIAIERIFDFVALLVLISVALVLDPRVSPLLWSAGAVSLAFIAVGLAVVFAFLSPSPRLARAGNAMLGRLPQRPRDWIAYQLRRGVEGLGALRRPLAMLQVLALSVLQWSCIVAAVWASAMAVGVEIAISGAIAVFVLTVIGLTLPSSPAQLGTTQLAYVVGFELVGATGTSAFAASLVYTCFVVVVMMLVGAAYWIVPQLAVLLGARRNEA